MGGSPDYEAEFEAYLAAEQEERAQRQRSWESGEPGRMSEEDAMDED